MGAKSPTLEVVSNKTRIDSGFIGERRRLPRLSISGEQFRLSNNGKLFSVADLSLDGMALRIIDSNDFGIFPIAMCFEGMLNLNSEKFHIKAQVRHLRSDTVGCSFCEITDSCKELITKFLDPTTLGRELKPMPSPDGGMVWYHGPSATNLQLWRGSDGQYSRLSVCVAGNFIQWEASGELSTGRLKDSTERGGSRCVEEYGIIKFETMMIEWDQIPDVNKLGIARKLFIGSNLPHDLRQWCIRHLEVNHGS